MQRLIRSRTRYTPPIFSAARNAKVFAAYVEHHGRRFKEAIASGNQKLAESEAYWLVRYARQAAWAGNLVLNEGRPVALVIEEIEREMAARRQETV